MTSSHPSHGESSQCSDMSSYEGPPSPPLSAASSGAHRPQLGRGPEHVDGCGQNLPLTQHFLPSDPAKWNVEDVFEFICSLPGWHCHIFHIPQQMFNISQNAGVAAPYSSGHQPWYWRCAGFCFSPVVKHLLQPTLSSNPA